MTFPTSADKIGRMDDAAIIKLLVNEKNFGKFVAGLENTVAHYEQEKQNLENTRLRYEQLLEKATKSGDKRSIEICGSGIAAIDARIEKIVPIIIRDTQAFLAQLEVLKVGVRSAIQAGKRDFKITAAQAARMKTMLKRAAFGLKLK